MGRNGEDKESRLSISIQNKLEQIKAEILVCKHKANEDWCEQCLHRKRLMEELKTLIENELA